MYNVAGSVPGQYDITKRNRSGDDTNRSHRGPRFVPFVVVLVVVLLLILHLIFLLLLRFLLVVDIVVAVVFGIVVVVIVVVLALAVMAVPRKPYVTTHTGANVQSQLH